MRMTTVQGTVTASSSGGATPNPPSAVYPGQIGLTNFSLAWWPPTSGPAPTGYNVYRNGVRTASNVPADPFGNSVPALIDGSPPSTLLGALTPGTSYTYTITSVASGVEGAPTAPFTITTLATGASQPPTRPVNPDSWIPPYRLPTGGTTFLCSILTRGASGTPAACSLDYAIANYAPGDRIILTAGAVYQTGASSGYTWPQKANPNKIWTYVTTTQDPGYASGGTLPPPTYNTNLGSGITDLSNGVGGNWADPATVLPSIAIIELQAVNSQCFLLQQACNYIRFVGVGFRAARIATGTVTLTAPPAVGATTGTLTAPFPAPTGNQNYVIIFSDGESRGVSINNGATSLSWSPGLFAAVTATVQYQFTGIANGYGVLMPFPTDPTHGSPSQVPCESIVFDRCVTGDDPSKIYTAYGFLRYGFHIFCNHCYITQCYTWGHSDTWDGQSTNAVTLTVAPILGATSGVLAANYGPGAGSYQALFSNNQVCTMSIPNASSGQTVTWSPALTSGATTSVATMLPQKTGYPVNESHAIFLHGGNNICVRNSHIEAVTENWFCGGVYIDQNNPPMNISNQFNYLGKNPVWFNNFSGADFKNIMEHKAGQFIEVTGSVLSYNAHSFVQSQRGRAFVMWANDNVGTINSVNYTNAWIKTTDVDIHQNLILHTGGVLYPSGPTGSVPGQNGGIYWAPNARVRFEDNLGYLDVPNLSAIGVTSTSPWSFHLGFNVPDQIWNRNTTIVNYSNTNWTSGTTFMNGMYSFSGVNTGTLFYGSDGYNPNGRQIYSDRMTVTNNYIDCNNAFTGSGMGHGATTFSTLFPAAASSTVSNNAYTLDTTAYTAPNDKPNTGQGAGMANFVSNTAFPANPHDWVVTSGPLATAATDGGPIGFRGFFFITTNSPLPNAATGTAYSMTPTATGATGAVTWSLVSATPNLGGWLTMTNTATGAIGGTPTQSTIETVTLSVTDSSATPRTVQKTFFIYVLTGGVLSPTLQILTTSLPSATVGAQYATQLSGTGGSGSLMWSLDSVSPNKHLWLKISPRGVLYGTPQYSSVSQQNQNETVVVRLTDAVGNTAVTSTFSLVINVGATALAILSPATLPNATKNGGYAYQLLASGGSPPYLHWSKVSSTGSNTWNVTPAGWLEGVPTNLTTDTVTVGLRDAVGNIATNVTVTITTDNNLQLAAIDFVTNFPLASIGGVVQIPDGRAGHKYSHQLFPANGGTGAGQSYSITNGYLPAGLSMSAAGLITGTPTNAGNAECTLRVTDSGSNATQSYPLVMNVGAINKGTKPAANTATGVCFVDTTGQLCDANGFRFIPVGLNRVHYDQTFSGYTTCGVNTVRYTLYLTQFRGATQPGSQTMATYTSQATTQHANNAQFTIFSNFYIPGTSTSMTGDGTPANMGTLAAWWCDNVAAYNASGIHGKSAINIANEWGPHSVNFQYSMAAAWSGGVGTGTYLLPVASVNTSTRVITLAASVNDATHPLANAAQIGYVYFAGGGISKAIQITGVGGTAGAYTVTATNAADVTGWTSGGTIAGGAMGMLRSAGYTDPFSIDAAGQGGQDIPTYMQYAVAIGQSDPLQNVILSYHAYAPSVSNYFAYISAINKANGAFITLTDTETFHPMVPAPLLNGGYSGTAPQNNSYSNIAGYFVSGVQGMTQINGQVPATFNVGGGPQPNPFTVNTTVNTTAFGTYTSGGTIVPSNNTTAGSAYCHVDRIASFMASIRGSGLAVLFEEYGPQTFSGPTPTWNDVLDQVQAAVANGFGDIYWALDDGSPFGMTIVGTSGTYTVPTQLSAPGIDVALNPRYGIHCRTTPIPSLLP